MGTGTSGHMIDISDVRHCRAPDDMPGLARYAANDGQEEDYPRAWNVTGEGDWAQNGWSVYLETKASYDEKLNFVGYTTLMVIRDPGSRYALWVYPEGSWKIDRTGFLWYADRLSVHGWPEDAVVSEGWNREIIREAFRTTGNRPGDLAGMV